MDRKKKYFKRRGKRGVIYLNERYKGVQLWDCLDTTDERIAEIRRREVHIAIERGDYQKNKILVGAVLEKTVESLLIGLSESTVKNYRLFVKKHLGPWFGEARLGDLQDSDLVEYKRARESEGAGKASISTEIWLFRKVMKQHGVDLAAVKEAFVNGPRVISRFLTEPEMLAVAEQIDLPVRAVVLVAAYSGLRKMDVVNLRWSAVDFKAGFISVQTKKRKKPTRIPIHEKLADALALVPRGVGDARVFNVNGNNVDWRWSCARAKVGCEWARFHDLRHFFGCYLATHGVRREVIAEILAITLETAARYARFDDATLEDAVQVFCKQSVSKVKKSV